MTRIITGQSVINRGQVVIGSDTFPDIDTEGEIDITPVIMGSTNIKFCPGQ